MKKKVLWLVASSVIGLSLVLASCGPAATTTPATTTPPTTTAPLTTAPRTPTVEEPKYGGLFTTINNTPVTIWDPAQISSASIVALTLIYENLGIGDWSKGWAGTKGYRFDHYGYFDIEKYGRGNLAESWEQPDPLTIIIHLRKGIKWQDKPPVNGREFVANDVVSSFDRYATHPKQTMFMVKPYLQSITATDKYTVVVKLKMPYSNAIHDLCFDDVGLMHPPEAAQYLTDWKYACGTGPFILVDYIEGSSITYKKNPNYWAYDEVNPQNRLPYVDSVKMLVIADRATMFSALRTGKIDMVQLAVSTLTGINRQEAELLEKTNPELMMHEYLEPRSLPSVAIRCNQPPFNDVRVRQAMNMAVNFREIIDKYLGGKGEVLNAPIMATWGDLYTPVEQLPNDVKELYSYNPQKARQLLAEAGYPKGFKTEIISYAAINDDVALLVGYWAAIGVDVTIRLVEYAVQVSYRSSVTYPGLCGSSLGIRDPVSYLRWMRSYSVYPGNMTGAEDPVYDKMLQEVLETMDINQQKAKIRELSTYLLRSSRFVNFPSRYLNIFWQPWVKNYHGEIALGSYCFGPVYARIWIDQELKKKMR